MARQQEGLMQAAACSSWPGQGHQALQAAAATQLLHRSCWLQAHRIHQPGAFAAKLAAQPGYNYTCMLLLVSDQVSAVMA
jgi:hypothetical protein